MAEISLSFPDGNVKSFEDGVNALEIAKSISNSLAKKAVSGRLDGELVSLTQPLHKDGKIEILTTADAEGLQVLRQTGAQILKMAISQNFPNVLFGESEADEDGFFVDTDKPETQISVDELDGLADAMKKIIDQKLPIATEEISVDEALQLVAGDQYQEALIKDNAVNDRVFINQIGDFKALSEGVTLPDTGSVKFFKLLSVAGAYWQGKSSNPMLQRIYATAFFKEADLDEDLKQRQEARERDHRVIGNQLDLFFVDPKVGAGLPYWMPNGATIRRTLERYIIDREVESGYQHVYTPVLANLDLYKQSGHWDHYREDMFPPMDMGEGEMLELRPMNCPSHIQIYKHHIRSYRELPLRIAEIGMMHRYEKSGALSGLQRVREMELNDGHTFVALEQIEKEFQSILKLMVSVYHDFDINDYTFRLSYRDPENTEKYFDDDEMWNRAQSMLKSAMDDMGLEYTEAEGEAAFYGPKLDVQTKTALGNEETLSTIQLDFMLPEQFDLHYVGEDGEQHRPVMIHRGIISTMERFTAYLTEIYKGAFPTWLAPHQVRIIPVSEQKHGEYAEKLNEDLRRHHIRSDVDARPEKMGYLIRDAQTNKIPYTLVVGDAEMNDNTVSVRQYGHEDSKEVNFEDFVSYVQKDLESYSRATDAEL
ncbi:threonine--tRNA ligase [Lentilactobacillus senioris DSM 24302 = JCM 17472]|uniref:Threonine--tRNA ligase n=1 Tax=Lentilactobacillus senioris DSM 24302 = JCM 17472 TaxID=1423802 RepID=A0A0R2CRN3_9LACO|nr:threonine--tRNA ligase [Lentilactobacillus senioris]KRM94446.1 threonine--tRNA ligase [Lentilactobacillus senioris DSM 24302 = JCM 17472]